MGDRLDGLERGVRRDEETGVTDRLGSGRLRQPVGAKVVVDIDQDESEDGLLKNDRDVWVSVIDGPMAGKVGTVRRKDLRPLK